MHPMHIQISRDRSEYTRQFNFVMMKISLTFHCTVVVIIVAGLGPSNDFELQLPPAMRCGCDALFVRRVCLSILTCQGLSVAMLKQEAKIVLQTASVHQ